MYARAKYTVLSLLLAVQSVFGQFSALSQLGASGVTDEGGAGQGNKLVKTGSDGLLSSSLVPANSATRLSNFVYVDPVNGVDPDGADNNAGSILNPYKTIEAALADSPAGAYEIFLCANVDNVSFDGAYAYTSLAISGAHGTRIATATSTDPATDLILVGVSIGELTAPNVANQGVQKRVFLRSGASVDTIRNIDAHVDIYTDGALPAYQDSNSELANVRCFTLVDSQSIVYNPTSGTWWWLGRDGLLYNTVSNALDNLASLFPTVIDDDTGHTFVLVYDPDNGGPLGWKWARALDNFVTSSDLASTLQEGGYVTEATIGNFGFLTDENLPETLSRYVTLSDVYTRVEIDTAFNSFDTRLKAWAQNNNPGGFLTGEPFHIGVSNVIYGQYRENLYETITNAIYNHERLGITVTNMASNTMARIWANSAMERNGDETIEYLFNLFTNHVWYLVKLYDETSAIAKRGYAVIGNPSLFEVDTTVRVYSGDALPADPAAPFSYGTVVASEGGKIVTLNSGDGFANNSPVYIYNPDADPPVGGPGTWIQTYSESYITYTHVVPYNPAWTVAYEEATGITNIYSAGEINDNFATKAELAEHQGLPARVVTGAVNVEYGRVLPSAAGQQVILYDTAFRNDTQTVDVSGTSDENSEYITLHGMSFVRNGDNGEVTIPSSSGAFVLNSNVRVSGTLENYTTYKVDPTNSVVQFDVPVQIQDLYASRQFSANSLEINPDTPINSDSFSAGAAYGLYPVKYVYSDSSGTEHRIVLSAGTYNSLYLVAGNRSIKLNNRGATIDGNLAITGSLGTNSTDNLKVSTALTLSGSASGGRTSGLGIGSNSVVIGSGAAIGDGSIAAGGGRAEGKSSISIGSGTSSTHAYSIAYGANCAAGGASGAESSFSIAMGANATSDRSHSLAYGDHAKAAGAYSRSHGYYTTASNDYSVAVGQRAVASANYATAHGEDVSAAGIRSFAQGIGAVASGNESFAFGKNVSAAGTSSAAIGIDNSPETSVKFVIEPYYSGGEPSENPKIYTYATASTSGGAIIIHDNPPDVLLTNNHVLRFGTKFAVVTNVDNNIIYLNRTLGTPESGEYVYLAGHVAYGNNSFVAGKNNRAIGAGSIAMGDQALATGSSSFAAGKSVSAIGDYSTAFGMNSDVVGTNSTAFGFDANVNGNYSVASGYRVDVNGTASVASGYRSSAMSDYSIAAGFGANSAELGAYTWAAPAPTYHTFSVSTSGNDLAFANYIVPDCKLKDVFSNISNNVEKIEFKTQPDSNDESTLIAIYKFDKTDGRWYKPEDGSSEPYTFTEDCSDLVLSPGLFKNRIVFHLEAGVTEVNLGILAVSSVSAYNSHGAGTYNINPVGGADGVYIGQSNLTQIIQAAVAAWMEANGY